MCYRGPNHDSRALTEYYMGPKHAKVHVLCTTLDQKRDKGHCSSGDQTMIEEH
jgi:hypothetical protein